jgi:N-methylhydantoinase B
MSTNRMEEIRQQVMWTRLLSVVEEQAQTLVRTAFSTSTREAGDVSAGVFDLDGQMLAQAVTGTPGHINSMARAVIHFLDVFPVDTMQDGDIYITNDPWKGTGHLHDLTVVSPTYKDGRMVALFACTSHLVDIGGIGLAPDGKQIYHEGLFIPIMPLARKGVMDEWLLNLIRANVREPVQVEGDIYALAACNETGSRRLLAMMAEYELDTLDALGAYIIEQSAKAMREAIDALPKGTWRFSMRADGYDTPIDLVAALTIGDGEIVVDFDGSSGTSTYGINCPMCYTEAYTSFGVKCVVAPRIPNNAGTLDAIKVVAPENTIINAPHPCAVVARSTMGHMLPDVVFGCLHQALPDRVPAEGTSNLWNLQLGAGHGITGSGADGKTPFMVTSFHSGGAGARPAQDGLSATPFPSGVRNVPVEITEAITPVVIWRKDYRADSGGAGAQRGGLGQTMEITNREDGPFGIFARFERVHYPARGREGGGPGAKGRLRLESGKELRNKGLQVVPQGDRLIIEMPGGGGYGDPLDRAPESVLKDTRNGLISLESAEQDYGVVIRDGAVDTEATAHRRAEGRTNSAGEA